MKITTRLIIGYGIIILLFAFSTTYQLAASRRLFVTVGRLSGTGFKAVTTSLQLMRDRDHLEESVRRFLPSRGTEEAEQLKESVADFQNNLELIKAQERSEKEQPEISRLVQFWTAFSAALARVQAAQPGQLSQELEETLDQLRTQSQTLYQLSQNSINAEAERSRELAEKAEAMLLGLGALVPVACVLAAFLVIRSVSLPLQALLEGARCLADGKTFYRLDTSRRDELSQLAKILNDLSPAIQGKSDPRRASDADRSAG